MNDSYFGVMSLIQKGCLRYQRWLSKGVLRLLPGVGGWLKVQVKRGAIEKMSHDS